MTDDQPTVARKMYEFTVEVTIAAPYTWKEPEVRYLVAEAIKGTTMKPLTVMSVDRIERT